MNNRQRAKSLLDQLALQELSIARLKKIEHVLKAAAEGKTIQWRLRGEWVIDHELSFTDEYTEYRIKPEVIRTKRFWWRSSMNRVGAPRITIVCESEDRREPRESWAGFVCWIDTEWQEHELPSA